MNDGLVIPIEANAATISGVAPASAKDSLVKKVAVDPFGSRLRSTQKSKPQISIKFVLRGSSTRVDSPCYGALT